MHVLVATAGALPPAAVTGIVERLAGSATVTVMTAIEVPRSFLQELATEEWRPFLDDPRPPETDQAVSRYVEERGRRIVEPVVSALEAIGVSATPRFVEATEPARAIVDTAAELGVDLVLLGATRPIFHEDAWQSVSVKVMQTCKVPMVMIPGSARGAEDEQGRFA